MEKEKYERLKKEIEENPEVLNGLTELEKLLAEKIWLTPEKSKS